MKIRLEGGEFLHGDGRIDGQTGLMKLAIAFRSSAKKPKIVASSVLYFYMQEMSLI